MKYVRYLIHIHLFQVRALLEQLQAPLAALETDYQKAEEAKLEAQKTYERSKTKVELAGCLVSSLGGEAEKWSKRVKTLIEQKENLVDNVLLASTFLSYLGPFSKPFRDRLVKEQWLPSMPMTPTADPLVVLTDEAEMTKWNVQGLPADSVSAENGVIVENCARWPLIMDPHLQVELAALVGVRKF